MLYETGFKKLKQGVLDSTQVMFVKPDEFHYYNSNETDYRDYTQKPRVIFNPHSTNLAASILLNDVYVAALS